MPSAKIKDKKTIDEISKKYSQGTSLQKLATEYRCGTIKPIKTALRNAGIALRTNDECIRKYTANYNYFDVIDTPNKAYVLGFIYADGCNYMNDKSRVYHLCIELKADDVDLLLDIKNELGYTGVIKYQTHKKTDCANTDTALFWICSHHICDELCKKGAPPNKSRKIKWPDWMPEHLASHFIRGVMDGDGCIDVRGRLSFAGTGDLMHGIEKCIYNNTGARGGVYKCTNTDCTYEVKYGKKEAARVLEWIYKDADLKLKRKYERYLDICSKTQMERCESRKNCTHDAWPTA